MSDEPELRDAPPWAMQEMIESEPELVAPILDDPAAREVATAVRTAAGNGAPVVVVGCGTSEHAARAIAATLNEALGSRRAAVARDSFEAALAPQATGVLIAVSHSGATEATLAALAAVPADAVRTVLVTNGAGPVTSHTITTPAEDRSWCHTVGYLSPLLAGLAVSEGIAADAARAVVEARLAARADLDAAAAVAAGCERLLVVGSGADEITASELALKIEEGAHIPCTPLGLEKVLHGHLPAADARTGIVLLRFDGRAAARRDARAEDAVRAVGEIGLPVARIDAFATPGLPPVAGALLDGALALQLLTLAIVHARGTNPDLIRREQPAYRAAAAASRT